MRVRPSLGLQLDTLPTGALVGLSSLAGRGDGTFWSTPERQPFLYGFRFGAGGPPETVAKLPIDGIPDGADTEGLAFTGPSTVALGLERDEPGRSSDRILLGRIQGGRVRVENHLTFDYRQFGLTAPTNQGIEGLAFAAGTLVAAGEPTGRLSDGGRFAPLMTYDLGDPATARRRAEPSTAAGRPHRLRLTSDDGRVSALSARRTPAGRIEVLAVERHYGTSRILRFHLPSPTRDIEPEVLVDLAPRFEGRIPNFEGISHDADRIVLVSDNHHGRVDGPTHVLTLPHPKAKALSEAALPIPGQMGTATLSDPRRWIESLGRSRPRSSGADARRSGGRRLGRLVGRRR